MKSKLIVAAIAAAFSALVVALPVMPWVDNQGAVPWYCRIAGFLC